VKNAIEAKKVATMPGCRTTPNLWFYTMLRCEVDSPNGEKFLNAIRVDWCK